MMMGAGYYGGMGMGGGFFMMFIGMIVIGLLLYFAITKQSTGNGHMVNTQPMQHSEALEIVKLRLANGEITVEEFEQMKKNLL